LRGNESDAVHDFLGGSEDEVPERYVAASPITHVGPDAPPFLLVHATGDVVDVEMARDMKSALDAEGNDARLLEIEGGGHVTNPGADAGRLYLQAAEDQPEAWLAIVDFLDEVLGAP
jgi:dipeptidyl aminopeptidase/acylaminoacyl peptidase